MSPVWKQILLLITLEAELDKYTMLHLAQNVADLEIICLRI